jgi:hypothetical protein
VKVFFVANMANQSESEVIMLKGCIISITVILAPIRHSRLLVPHASLSKTAHIISEQLSHMFAQIVLSFKRHTT